MPHPEQEHALMIEVARLTRECNSLHSRLASETARADRNAKEIAETLDALSGATDRTIAAQSERDAARATTEKWLRVVEQLRENLNATLLERDTVKEALAAARREIEVAREKYLREGFALAQAHAEVSEHDGWNRTAPFIEWREANAQLEAALAAPAAGDSKPYPDPRCTCHARHDGKHTQACELWNTTGGM